MRSHRRAIAETEGSVAASSIMSELRAEFFHGRVPASDAKGAWHKVPDYPGYDYRKAIVPLEAARKGLDPAAADFRAGAVKARAAAAGRRFFLFIELDLRAI